MHTPRKVVRKMYSNELDGCNLINKLAIRPFPVVFDDAVRFMHFNIN